MADVKFKLIKHDCSFSVNKGWRIDVLLTAVRGDPITNIPPLSIRNARRSAGALKLD